MCGRYNLRTPASELVEFFELHAPPVWTPRYNIAPTQSVLAIRAHGDARMPALFRWGLIPNWAKDPAIGSRMINARSETVSDKPSFRSAFRRRRCLVLADGFYEWQATGGARKQPWHIERQDGRPFAFAGLWESWDSGEGSAIESCTIITTTPNSRLAEIHDRMPVILDADSYDEWINPEGQDVDRLLELLVPCPDDFLVTHPVSTYVNSPKNEGPECVEPVGK